MGSWLARLAMTVVGVALTAFVNLIMICAVGSALWLGFEAIAGQQTTGFVTDATRHTIQGNKGPDVHYCYGTFASDDHEIVGRRVHVFIDGGCQQAKQQPATLVHGLGSPVTQLISDPDESDTMAFNGLFGMTEGAVIDWHNFLTQLWPLAFLIPTAAGIDAVIIVGLRKRRRASCF